MENQVLIVVLESGSVRYTEDVIERIRRIEGVKAARTIETVIQHAIPEISV
jgi:nitrate reductase NapAB chaperone NapD